MHLPSCDHFHAIEQLANARSQLGRVLQALAAGHWK